MPLVDGLLHRWVKSRNTGLPKNQNSTLEYQAISNIEMPRRFPHTFFYAVIFMRAVVLFRLECSGTEIAECAYHHPENTSVSIFPYAAQAATVSVPNALMLA